MSKAEEYREAILAVAFAATVLAEHDVPALLEAIGRADSIGPILDPTLWRDRHAAMDQDAEMLRAALPLHKLGKKLAEMRARSEKR